MAAFLAGARRFIHRKPRWMSLFSFTTTKHLPVLIGGFTFTAISSLSVPIFSVLLGEIFNTFTLFGGGKVAKQDLTPKISKYAVHLVGLGAINWVCNSVYFILFVIYGEFQVANARTMLFERLLQKSQEWFETQPDGTRVFLSSLQGQIEDLQKATSQPLGLALQYSFRAIFSLALAFFTSWNLTLVTLAGIPFLSAALSFLSNKTNSCMEAQKTELGHLSLIVDNATSSIDSVKSFNGQDTEIQNFVSSVDNAAIHYLRRARLTSLQISILRLMTFGMFVQGFWYGSSLATSGEISAGEVLRTFWACLAAAQSMEFLMPQIVILAKGKDAALSLIHTLSSESENTVRGEGRSSVYPKFCEGDIEVSNVSFAYPAQPNRPVLKSTSFFFPAGETTFVIGRSGSGKSTLGQLLTRFYLPLSGEILIDGAPIQSLSIDWIRNNITLLEQRSVLFNESIFMNIAFGSRNYEGLSKVDVRECIDLARLQSTIDDLPKGIDTCVGHGGDFLSGGQKQRVAIARARLRDTPILIMDEPTSALDATNRVEITKAIREWRRGKTTIIITHDMSQIMDHDFAYIMDQGSVIQAGYRYELEESNTCFATSGKLHREESEHGVAHSSPDRYSSVSSRASTESTRGPSPDSFARHSELVQHSYAIHGYKRSIQSIRQSADSRGVRSRRESIGMQMFELNTVHADNTNFQSNRFRQSILPVNDVVNEINRARSKHRSKRPSKNAARLAPQETMSLGRIMLTILPNLTRGQKLLLLLGCFSTLGHSMATPLFSYCLSKLLETFYNKQAKASTWSLIVLGIAVGDGVISFLMHYLLELCGQAWVDRLRKRGLHHILDQPRKWFEEAGNEPSQLTSSLNHSAEEMRNLVGHFGGYVLVATSVTVVAIIWCMAVCWKLTLVAVACGPVIYAITRGLEKTTGMWERRCTGVKTTASEIFIETFSQIRTVRTLTLEPYFHKKHMKAAALCMVLGVKKAVYTGFLFGLVESMIIFVSSLIFYYGAVLVSSLEFTVTSLMTVFSVLLFSIGYASTVLSWIPQISVSHIMANQVLRLAHLPRGASHEHQGTLKITTAAPVKITNLNFRYPSRPDAHVLRDVSITIPRNQSTAIVGRSGSGKSTIASLLLNLYEVPTTTTTSRISLNGIDLQRIHTPTLRTLITIVSQRPSIFPGTVADNISYGLEPDSPLRTMFHIRAAAESAGIDEFITSLPKGYFTLIGDGGAGMSGGQAQRLVIARALVRQPQLLILDEATSSLDPNNAKIIRRTVQRLVATRLGLTVLIITHARDMMEIADNVIVIDKGRVVEAGKYEVLARRQGGKLRALIEEEEENSEVNG
ncbi:ABC a-pheromone efflux pump AtrD [Aspergillus eucalypticola CBS 122712]|uniref:ABC a-pheromone efflux pump AtrD n=1 Tax=Aspergillus eucalypticola (strain CBS 122712 / IBT 29274) TaxID=1448314 RepID=A0A317UZZ8_ASPEC|nr:ABC a-pheromone efflux pump AtrD [Aspergillus eucalypticola CBS 122712]PWY66959.1 ABC a-pheromone efflux pump AtrD [Aspergillus eucalypticola CBS 122712]